MGYGAQFHLERKNGGDWEKVPTLDGAEGRWFLLLYPIPLGKSVSDEITWDDLYGALPAGDYRLCKEVQQGRGETLEERMYYAEFFLMG